MSQRRLGSFLLFGSLLLVTPFLVGSSRGVEKSVFSAMATLADVKETLEGKQELLTEMYASLADAPDERRSETVALAEKHYLYSQDVYRLARNFLDASGSRHPKYAAFWDRYDERLRELWGEIDTTWRRISGENSGGGTPYAAAPDTTERDGAREAVLAAPTLAEATASSEGAEGAEAADDAARLAAEATREVLEEPEEKTLEADLLERYREGYQRFAAGRPADLEAATEIFEEILEIQPTFHLARYWLSKTYVLRGDAEVAGEHADELLEQQPNLQIAKDLVREVGALRAREVAAAAPEAATPPSVASARTVAAAPAVRTPEPARRTEPEPSSTRRPAPPEAPLRTASFPGAGSDLPPLRTPDAAPGAEGPRAVAVMVENSRHARPQSGLLHADYVYEIPVEGGITRFMAVFRDHEREVAELGPVRSARHYFVNQLASFDAVYAHCGGSTQGYAALKRQGIDHIDEIRNGYGFWRRKDRKAPHNLYTKLADVLEGARRKGFRLAGDVSSEVLPLGERPVRAATDEYQDLVLPYYYRYKVEYTYDPLTNLYSRSINGEPHMDALTDQQIAVENVVVIRTDMRKIDSYGRLDMDLIGSGQGAVYRGGEVLEGRWIRNDRASRFALEDSRGRRIAMNPGRTWVHVIQANRDIALKRRPLPPKVLAQLQRVREQEKRTAAPAGKPLRVGRAPASARGDVSGTVVQPSAEEPAEPVRTASLARSAKPAKRGAPSRPSRGRALEGVVTIGGPKAPTAPSPARTAGSASSLRAAAPAKRVLPSPRRPAGAASASDADADEAYRRSVEAAPAEVALAAPAGKTPDEPARTSRTWREGLGGEYDLADFSLDSF